MRKHNGMRPQDVAILINIASWGERPWKYADLAHSLRISQSEVAEGLHRCWAARLVDPSKRRVFRESLLEFLLHGLKYVFPAQPGPIVRGVPTSISAPPLSGVIVSEKEVFVWPDPSGTQRGQAVAPLYGGQIEAAAADPDLYALFTLLDAIRIGRPREFQAAAALLQEKIKPLAYAQP